MLLDDGDVVDDDSTLGVTDGFGIGSMGVTVVKSALDNGIAVDVVLSLLVTAVVSSGADDMEA